jgi:hypothetical protein
MSPSARACGGVLLACLAALAPACGGDGTGPNDSAGIVAYIGLTGVPESERLFVGQSIVIQASTFDHDHRLITGATLSWQSSDTNVATLHAWENGVVVQGKSPGVVVIRVAAQQASASVTLTVEVVPVASVSVTPSSAAGYVGTTTQLQATPHDAAGGILSDRPVTWTTSDPQKATVDTTGRVTARAAGTVTITATSEGKSAAAALTIIPRPTADWGGVTGEWVTYQRDTSHTGYVPATLDPATFALAWEVTLASGVPLNPVTVGDGKVFVSTTAYFGVQQLHALSASSGARLWLHDFGGIHSVHPPAYAGGTVYVTTGGHEDSFLWAFDAATGAQRFLAPYGNQWSRWYAPVVLGGTVYMAGGYYGGMYAFNAADGAERWFVPLNQYDEFTPAVRNGRVYAYTGSYDPKVTATDAATGSVIYEIPDPGFEWQGWSMNLAPVLGASDNLLATQGGRLLSFDLQNRAIGWQVSGGYAGQVTLAEGVVYAFKGPGIEARRESDGSLLWAWSRPDNSHRVIPTIATKNLLFISGDNTTYAVDLGARLQGWSYPAGGHLALSSDGLLLIAQPTGKLTAIRVR